MRAPTRPVPSPRSCLRSFFSLTREVVGEYREAQIPVPWSALEAERAERLPTDAARRADLELAVRLRRRLSVLAAADEGSRLALAEWSELARQFEGPEGPYSWAAAAEHGAWLISRQLARTRGKDPAPAARRPAPGAAASSHASPPPPPPWPDAIERELGRLSEQCRGLLRGDSGASPASAVAATLYGPAPGGDGEAAHTPEASPPTTRPPPPVPSGDYYHFEPFEWLYAGTAPLDFASTVEARQGAVVSLASLACAIGSRAGVPLVPLPAVGRRLALDPKVEAMKASIKSRSVSLMDTPSSIYWLLEAREGASKGEEEAGPASAPASTPVSASTDAASAPAGTGTGASVARPRFIDSATGRALTLEGAKALHPGFLPASRLPAAPPGATFWAGYARLTFEAHQRRGEADEAASWIYVLLALDEHSPEWEYMVSPR